MTARCVLALYGTPFRGSGSATGAWRKYVPEVGA